jgi:hypothetical protein
MEERAVIAVDKASNVHRPDPANDQLRQAFGRWQCRVRQISARKEEGRPNAGMAPAVVAADGAVLCQVVTVMCRLPEYSATMEFRHLVRRTLDPATRREDALKLLAESYYQRWDEFSLELTACFAPGSELARQLIALGVCTLRFEQFNQCFDISVRPRLLSANDPSHEATFWHNHLFNPALSAECSILGFEPDWGASTAKP